MISARLSGLLLVLVLGGCGLKGDLYLPPPQSAPAATPEPAGDDPQEDPAAEPATGGEG